MRIDGRSIIVTGASSGIGRALALELAGRGAVLTLASRNEASLSEVASAIEERHPGRAPSVTPCDVRDAAAVTWLMGATVERHGAIDVLVNNAAVSVYGPADLTPTDAFRDMVEVNLLGAFTCMREALPFMRSRESGLIVNMASVAGLYGVPYLGPYGATKSALVTLSQCLRVELAGTGIDVMTVYPDYTETSIFDRELRVGTAVRPPGPYAPAEDVARTIADGIERGKRDLILSARGRQLWLLRSIMPGYVERRLRRLAAALAGEGARKGNT